MSTDLFIIRHGESLGNFNNLFLGHTDLDLTEHGLKQAECTAEYLKDISIDFVYSSPLLRAYHTALPNAKIRGLNVICDDGLKEIYGGDWEARSIPELITEYPIEFTEGFKNNFGKFAADNLHIESVDALSKRVEATLIKIAKAHEEKKIIVVSHGAAIRAMWGRISHLSPDEVSNELPYASNASVTRVRYDEGKLIPISYSEDGHLGNTKTNLDL